MVQLNRQYSPETWDIYSRLERSLDPDGPDALFALAGSYLAPGARIVDVGCRDAAHLVRLLVENPGTTGIGVEPVERHLAMARETIATVTSRDRIALVGGTLEECGLDAGSADLIWCRDVLEQVPDPDRFVGAAARLLAADGRMIVYTNLVTDRLEPGEAAMMRRHLGVVFENMDERVVLGAYARAGLDVERTMVIGGEWREYAEERTRPVSRALLQLSRLRRQRDAIVAERGQDLYDHIEANLHWLLFQFIGKFEPVIHVLRHR